MNLEKVRYRKGREGKQSTRCVVKSMPMATAFAITSTGIAFASFAVQLLDLG